MAGSSASDDSKGINAKIKQDMKVSRTFNREHSGDGIQASGSGEAVPSRSKYPVPAIEPAEPIHLAGGPVYLN